MRSSGQSSAHRSVAELEVDLKAWNDDPKSFVWTKSADEILDSLTSYLQRTNDSGH